MDEEQIRQICRERGLRLRTKSEMDLSAYLTMLIGIGAFFLWEHVFDAGWIAVFAVALLFVEAAVRVARNR